MPTAAQLHGCFLQECIMHMQGESIAGSSRHALLVQGRAYATDCEVALMGFLWRFSSIGTARAKLAAHGGIPATMAPAAQHLQPAAGTGAAALAATLHIQDPLTGSCRSWWVAWM
jgi:hypothetical protein